MSDRTLILTLAQLIAAAAWADGDLNAEEIDQLKALLRQLPQRSGKREVEIAGQDWAQVEIYLHQPASAEERHRLVRQLQDALHSPRERAWALATLEDLVRADGVVTDAEQALVDEVREALNTLDLGILSRIGRLISGRVRRTDAAKQRADVDDFVQNRVYYLLRRRPDLDPQALGLSDAELRKLSLAGALMARVAAVDQAVEGEERGALSGALQHGWGLGPSVADVVAEIAVSPGAGEIDYVRLTNGFLNLTSEAERIRFLVALFEVAAADGRISPAETDEVRRIAHSLKLSPGQVNEARDRATQRRSTAG